MAIGLPKIGKSCGRSEFDECIVHGEQEQKEKADAWLISIGLQGAAELKVSSVLLDLAIRNVKGEITRDEVNQRLKERYGDTLLEEPKSGLNGGYEIIPPDSPRIKEIEDYNRKIPPELYARLDNERERQALLSDNSANS